jgi:hypothetical protein
MEAYHGQIFSVILFLHGLVGSFLVVVCEPPTTAMPAARGLGRYPYLVTRRLFLFLCDDYENCFLEDLQGEIGPPSKAYFFNIKMCSV